jgi:hypothetical protein
MLFDLFLGLMGVGLFMFGVFALELLSDTPIGKKFFNCFSKKFFDVDLESMED